MKVIEEITTQTSQGTRETANSIGNLAGLAGELRRSVTGFKLPGEVETQVPVVEDFHDQPRLVGQSGRY